MSDVAADGAPVMLLDSASLWFRAFYGVPATLTAADGTPVNAVRGFCDMVARLVRARQPGSVVACLDRDWRPAFRVRGLLVWGFTGGLLASVLRLAGWELPWDLEHVVGLPPAMYEGRT